MDAFIIMPNHVHGIIIIDKKYNDNNKNETINNLNNGITDNSMGDTTERGGHDWRDDCRDKACLVSTPHKPHHKQRHKPHHPFRRKHPYQTTIYHQDRNVFAIPGKIIFHQ